MIENSAYSAIAELDLEPIKFKLMHHTFGEGWSKAKADAIDLEYRRFLYLQYANPEAEASPTEDVDTFWHYHILDTMKYAADCEKAFGYFLHHFPYLGLLDSDEQDADIKAAHRTRELYEATFGEPYLRAETHTEKDVVSRTLTSQQGSATRCMACIVGRPEAKAARCMACIAARPSARKASCEPCTIAGPASRQLYSRASKFILSPQAA